MRANTSMPRSALAQLGVVECARARRRSTRVRRARRGRAARAIAARGDARGRR
ncbi:MAG: hypothetical protein MZV49_26415 [Rhodopseudomonas palustris]|nr:hypothetical protein [Rhodopseudomonas palustris]